MGKRGLASLDRARLEGQRALVRVDFNVPLQQGLVTDNLRIRAALPTITYLREAGARVVLCSHLGRPEGRPDPRYSLAPVARELERLLGAPVVFLADPLGADAEGATRRLPRGAVALLENTRFHPGEEANDPALAAAYARLGDFFVNDAFGAAHRAHATTAAVARLLKPAVAGFLMERELRFLGEALQHPARPFVAILGGAKVSGKVDLIETLLPRVDRILVGGAMACTFFRALGLEVGASLVEADRVELARGLLERAGDKLVLPVGAVVARELAPGVETRQVPRGAIPAGWAMYDVDEATIAAFADQVHRARTVLWNGPLGVFEVPPFDRGTRAMAEELARATTRGVMTIVGGGDTAAAVAAAGLSDRMTHVSTGGGAALEFLEGRTLPGVDALDDA
jgi:phosphoglycerate kinase